MKPIFNLTVHGIGRVDRPLDPGECDVWVSVPQFEQVLDQVAERRDVRLTFDDGNRSDLEIALPRLRARGLRADFFVLAGQLGEPGRLNAADVRELAGAGMRIGSHGWAHRDWRLIDELQAQEEFDQARKVLSDLVNREVMTMSIPMGSYDRHVLRKLRRAGATRVYTSDGGSTWPDRWLQPRTSLRETLDDAWVTRVLGPQPWHAQGRRAAGRAYKRWRGRP